MLRGLRLRVSRTVTDLATSGASTFAVSIRVGKTG
jgi:hypothetical protein